MTNKNKKIPTMPINKTQKRLYAGSSDPTFEHDTLKAMEQYLNNPTAYFGQMMYCKENDKHYSISKNAQDEKILKEIGSDQSGNLKIVETLDERDALEDVSYGLMCYVIEEGVYFSYRRGLEEEGEKDGWEPFKGAGGGSAVIGSLVSKMDGTEQSISVGQPLVVDLSFSTPNIGPGTLYVLSEGTQLMKEPIRMGAHNISIDLEKGSYNLQIYIVDRGGVHTNTVLITVRCGGLEIKTTFNDKKDYNVGTRIKFPYTIESISEKPINVYFKIGDKTYETTGNNGPNSYQLPANLGAGKHKIEVWATSGEYVSNKIVFVLVMLNSDSLFVSSLFDKETAEEGDQLVIDYRVSMKGVNDFNVVYYVDGEEKRRGKAYNGANTFLISDLKLGPRVIKIEVSTKDNAQKASVEIPITIVESSYQLKQPVTEGLVAWFDAYGLSNQDSDVTTWKNKVEESEYVDHVGTLYNFNYNTNGWMKNGLKMNGNSYVKLDLKPFEDNAVTGLTIDVEFETEDIGNENARVLDCTTSTTSGVGCFIDTGMALIKSNANEVKSSFAQGEKTRVTYVIDRVEKITKLYVNAVLSAVAFLKDAGEGNHEVLEEFTHPECIYLNSQKGKENFGDCTVYSVRVYDRPLESDEVLRNHIADIRDDKALQKKKWDFNYKDTIPTMHFIGDVTEMTKEKKVELQIRYLSTDERLYGQSFDLPRCVVNWQGTSSIVYDVKNYKIRLYEAPNGTEEEGAKLKKHKHALREGMIEESTFVLKADYMESSHANNTGCAKIVNKYLYDKDKPLPPKKKNPELNIVSAIDGFPIKLFINGKSMGVFNFNLDKGNEKSFGFEKDNPNCLSFEVKANTDTTAGAFHKWPGVSEKYPTELAYLKDSFEQRFPEEKEGEEEKTQYAYDKLKRIVNWVADASNDEFKANFEKYFDKEYTFKYYLFTLTMGLVDNLGKNMMLTTWDGDIWFPCFYDLDTCLSLDNSGYIQFDSDIEIAPKYYNTSGSKLWTKLWANFEKELTKLYVDMRSTIFKEENLLNVLIGEQIDQIPESLYNEDSQRKYIEHPKYIHMLHGSRREPMRKWIKERLLYLDSKFGYELNTQDAITVRANKQARVAFKIKTYSPMYIKVKWSNEAAGVMIKKVGRNETVEFAHTLTTATDQEILIYAANHIKEIGDLTNMSPSSLTLGHAKGLTKLECRNSPNLKALGLDGSLKNLQSIDISGCSKLGTADGSNGIDVSKCDNLKTLNVQGTALKSITFNPNGGNLEELYLSNSLTALHLVNQYSLSKVMSPSPEYMGRLAHRTNYDNGSKISILVIENCPKLTHLGQNTTNNIDEGLVCNYRRIALNKQPDDFDISKDEYYQAFTLAAFCRLETVRITNSLLNYRYYNVNASPSLSSISFSKMPKLKGLILTGNRTYGASGGNTPFNFEGEPAFDSINISECDEFDTLIIQSPNIWMFNEAYKFKPNFTLDLSKLPLKKFVCNIALQNLNKIILPECIEEFSHSTTYMSANNGSAPDGSGGNYTHSDSPLETIIIAGTGVSDEFRGIDLANRQLKNVNLNGLTQKVDIIKNINCEAIDLCPRMLSEHITDQPLENVKINLNKFKGNSLASMFKNMDMTKVHVTLDNKLTVEGIDYTSMFNSTINVLWERIKWIKNLPKGTFAYTFQNSDVDSLEVGHMIGPTTTILNFCFSGMTKVTSIDLTGAELSNVTSLYCTFERCSKLTRLNLTSEATKINSMQGFCDRCWALTDLDLSGIIGGSVTNINYGFRECTSLTNLVFFEGMKKSISLNQSNNLTVTSLQSVIDNIGIADSGQFLELGSTNLSKLSEEYKEKARLKNWTLPI